MKVELAIKSGRYERGERLKLSVSQLGREVATVRKLASELDTILKSGVAATNLAPPAPQPNYKKRPAPIEYEPRQSPNS